MIRFRNLLPLTAVVLVGVAILGAPPQASAAFTLNITDGSNTVNVTDGGAGDLDMAQNGLIVYSGSVGVFNIQSNFGTSNAPGTPNQAQITINDTSITSNGFTGSKTLTFTLQDDGFFLPTTSPTAMESQVSTTQLPTGDKVTYQSFLNAGPGTLLTLNTVGGTRISDPVSISSTPFSLTSVTIFTITGTGGAETIQFTGLTAVATPEPVGVLLVLSGLPVLGFGWRRCRAKA